MSLKKVFVFILLLGSCAQASKKTEKPEASSSFLPAKQNLEALEREEFQKPQDPALKMALAKAYWCAGNKAFAVEHWRWVLRFAPQSPQAKEARSFVALVQKHQETSINQALNCSAMD